MDQGLAAEVVGIVKPWADEGAGDTPEDKTMRKSQGRGGKGPNTLTGTGLQINWTQGDPIEASSGNRYVNLVPTHESRPTNHEPRRKE